MVTVYGANGEPREKTLLVGALSTRIQSLDVAVETKTQDNVFVTIIVSTQYMGLKDPERMYDAFYKLTAGRGGGGPGRSVHYCAHGSTSSRST